MNNPIRLVIVDDHALIRQTWKMVLQRDDRIRVIGECVSGADAIAFVEKERPDVMLMDVNMEPVNGFEATEAITKKFPDIHIIGTSINNQPSYVRNMLQAGAKGYVTKNSPSEEMIEAIFIVCNGGTYLCADVRTQMASNKGI